VTDTIKEFLVGLKWKVDKSGEADVQRAIDGVTKGLMGIAALVGSAVAAVAVGVQRMAKEFDQLYYASDRIGATVADINAFKYAVSQMGGTAEGAAASLEGLSRKMRENPGYAKQIEAATGTHIQNGKLTLQNLEDIGKFFHTLQETGRGYQAIQWAEAWGIDEKTMRAMSQGVEKFADQYKRKMSDAGLNPEEAAKNANKYMQTWRSVWETIGVSWDAALAKIMTGQGNSLKALDEALEHTAKSNSEALMALVKLFDDMATGLIKSVGGSNDLETAIKNIDRGLIGFTETVRTVFREIREWVEWMDNSTFMKTLNKWAGVGQTPTKNDPHVDHSEPRKFDFKDSAGNQAKRDREQTHDTRNWWQRNAPSWAGGKADPADGDSKAGHQGASVHDAAQRGGSAKAATRSFMMKAAMDQLRKEGVPEDHLRAAAAHLVGQADMESGLDPNKPHDGGTGYGIYGARLERRTKMLNWLAENGYERNSAEGQMRYMSHEAMSGKYPRTKETLMGATDEGLTAGSRVITHEFEAPAIDNDRSGATKNAYRTGPDAPANTNEDKRRARQAGYPMGWNPRAGNLNHHNSNAIAPLGTGGPNVTSWHNPITNNISQKVEIKIDGADSPGATGAAVGSQMKRTNADLTRNMQGAAN
jgi:hypothetical protein